MNPNELNEEYKHSLKLIAELGYKRFLSEVIYDLLDKDPDNGSLREKYEARYKRSFSKGMSTPNLKEKKK